MTIATRIEKTDEKLRRRNGGGETHAVNFNLRAERRLSETRASFRRYWTHRARAHQAEARRLQALGLLKAAAFEERDAEDCLRQVEALQ